MSRCLDVVTSAVGLLIASPVMAAIAAWIRLDDPGPVLYRQERIGRDGEPFQILKFRTMTVGAEHEGLGLAVAVNDSRVTRAGAILRKTSLDELPQLWNVLRGDMALVGPRPTLRNQVERYTPTQLRRLEVRPGVTGWAQIHGRNTLPWSRRIELDVWYVDHRSLWLDLRIIARTPVSLLRGGQYNESGVTTDLD